MGHTAKTVPSCSQIVEKWEPPKKALKKTIFGLAKNAKTLEKQGLSKIKQNPENFFSGSFLLVDHQGLEGRLEKRKNREMEGSPHCSRLEIPKIYPKYERMIMIIEK